MSKHISHVLPLSTYASSSSLSLSLSYAQAFGLLEAIPTKHKKPYQKTNKKRKYSITSMGSTAAHTWKNDIATTLRLNNDLQKQSYELLLANLLWIYIDWDFAMKNIA